MKNVRLLLLVCIVLSAISVTTHGQQISPTAGDLGSVIEQTPVGRYTYGTSSTTIYTIADWNFTPLTSPTAWAWNGGKYLTGVGGSEMENGPNLPEGASVVAIELEACDTSAYGQVVGFFGYCSSPAGSCTAIQGFNTGAEFVGGCQYFSTTLGTPHTVDNRNNRYIVQWTNTSYDGTTTFRAFRIYYKLQVSTPPVTATFADVPTTHPFYKFVEALYASGITAGCTPPNFCPDAPVTRGQMAVFLAGALGLHWAP